MWTGRERCGEEGGRNVERRGEEMWRGGENVERRGDIDGEGDRERGERDIIRD